MSTLGTIELATYKKLAIKADAVLKQLHLLDKPNKSGRPLSIPIKEAVTLALYWHTSGRTTKKSVYDDFKEHLHCTYKTLVIAINRQCWIIAYILMKLFRLNHSGAHPVKHVDSTPLPVCKVKNAKHHKTMTEFAGWGKTGMGWFYGLKLHMCSDLNRKILALKLTSGNTDDRYVVIDLTKELDGIFVMDAGYISKKLEQEIFVEGKRIALIQPRRSMKKLATQLELALYQTRFQIEFNFRDLKMFFGLVSSTPRSVEGYLTNYFSSLVGYLLS